ncbi:MAG: hypothetical protein ACK559_05775, partial [bacterium]
MLAVGPPRSEMVPEKPGRAARLSTSRSTLSALRDTTSLPWWMVSAQNEQPPEQPRLTVTLPSMLCSAGTGAR